MRKTLIVAAFAASLLPFAAQASGDGAAAGAVTGAVGGALVGGPVGAVVGAGVGGVVGGVTTGPEKGTVVVPETTGSVECTSRTTTTQNAYGDTTTTRSTNCP